MDYYKLKKAVYEFIDSQLSHEFIEIKRIVLNCSRKFGTGERIVTEYLALRQDVGEIHMDNLHVKLNGLPNKKESDANEEKHLVELGGV